MVTMANKAKADEKKSLRLKNILVRVWCEGVVRESRREVVRLFQ